MPRLHLPAADAALSAEGSNPWFGLSLAVEDVNGDGYADVMMGAANHNGGIGRAYLFLSTGATGLNATVSAAAADSILTGETGSQFGRSMGAR